MPLPSILFFKGFKTAVCLASNPPNASAGFQGNNSYSYIHAPAICFSGGSSPPSHPPNASASFQGNNSYSYMPLPSVFQGVQDCRLPGLKPPKRFQPSRRPPRQQLLQLYIHAPAICFSGGSRLLFARPQTPQTLPTLPQASKATTLTATTCPCHLFFRGFKTAVCPASNPPNASNPPAGLQGNNSYSYMPLPSVFQGVQDCRLPGLKPPKRFQPSRRPPRQQLLQLHAPAIYFSRGSRLPFKATTLTATTCPCHLFFRGFKTAVCPASHPPNASNPSAGLQGNNSYSYIYMPLPSVFQGVQDCRLPGLKPPKRFQPSRRPPRHQLTATCPCHRFYIFQGVQDCRLPGLKPSKRFRRLPRQELLQLHTCLCHLFFRGFKPALTPSKRFRRLPRQQLLQLHAPAICFSGGSRLPFARPLTPQTLPTLPQASKATTLTAIYTCPCHLFFRGFKNSCHLFFRGFKTASADPGLCQGRGGAWDHRRCGTWLSGRKQRHTPSRQHLCQLHAPAIYMPLPFARPQTLQTLRRPPRQQLLQLHAPAICFPGGSRQVCLASNPPNASAGLQGNNSYSYYMSLPSVFQGVQDCRLPLIFTGSGGSRYIYMMLFFISRSNVPTPIGSTHVSCHVCVN